MLGVPGGARIGNGLTNKHAAWRATREAAKPFWRA
jgi:hypothetical protein